MRRWADLITSGNFTHHPVLLFARSSSSCAVPQTLTPDESPIQISNPSTNNPTAQLHLILSNPSWPKNPSLTSLIPSLSPTHIASLFQTLPLDLKTALDFFDCLSKNPNFHHSVESHAALLKLLAKSKLLGSAERIRISMLKFCSSVEETRLALNSIMDLDQRTLYPKVKIVLRRYNSLLVSLAKFSIVDDMKRVYGRMLKDGILPSISPIISWSMLVVSKGRYLKPICIWGLCYGQTFSRIPILIIL